MKNGQFLILVRTPEDPDFDDEWRDLGEGPWNTYKAAEEFAQTEVGVEWIIVQVVSVEGQKDR